MKLTEKELERREVQRLHEESDAHKNIVKKKLSAKEKIIEKVAKGESKETIKKYIKGEYPSMSDGLIDSLITMRMNMYKQEKAKKTNGSGKKTGKRASRNYTTH